MNARLLAVVVALAVALPGTASAQKVFFSPISAANAVAGGGTEDQFALANANVASAKVLTTAGMTTQVMAGPVGTGTSAAVDAANAAPVAAAFVTIASNAGGGHGPQSFFYTGSTNGQTLATDIDTAEHAATMPAAVTFVVFHDCVTDHSLPGSESDFLRSTAGQNSIGTAIASGTCTFLGKTCPVTCTPGGACSTGLQGVCAAGTYTCPGGVLTCTQNVQSSAEVCDNKDNNCNGSTDEGDPGGGAACNTGKSGVCAAGINHCQAGAITCVQTTASSAEICDNKDNNCNGTTDEGDPGGGGACVTGKLGVCAAGIKHCQGGAIVCVQTTASSAEKCDNLDNDCDGVTDNSPVCADAGSPPGKDAGSPPGQDASAPPGLDAATPPGRDAGQSPGVDAAHPPGADGALLPGEDAAEVFDEDAGEEPGMDVRTRRRDAGGLPTQSGACGCATGGEATMLLGALALISLVARRRRI